MTSLTSTEQIARVFQTNIISFLDELIDLFPSDSELIVIRLLLKETVSPDLIIASFIKEIIPNKESIKNRDDNFFLNSSLFKTFNSSKVNHLKVLWKSDTLDDDDRQIIWKWFDTFIYLAEQYQKFE